MSGFGAQLNPPIKRPVGRPPGTGANKIAKVVEESKLTEAMRLATERLSEADVDNLDPLEVIKIAMKIAVRAASWFKAAELADMIVSYVHPKLQAVSVTNINDDAAKSKDALERELREIDATAQAANKARIEAARMQGEVSELGDRGVVPSWIPTGEASRPSVNGA